MYAISMFLCISSVELTYSTCRSQVLSWVAALLACISLAIDMHSVSHVLTSDSTIIGWMEFGSYVFLILELFFKSVAFG